MSSLSAFWFSLVAAKYFKQELETLQILTCLLLVPRASLMGAAHIFFAMHDRNQQFPTFFFTFHFLLEFLMTITVSFSATSMPLPVHSLIPRCRARLLQCLQPWSFIFAQSLGHNVLPRGRRDLRGQVRGMGKGGSTCSISASFG